MKRFGLAALIVLAGGCGDHSSARHAPAGTTPCQRNPPAAGECIARHFGIHRGFALPSGKQCADWSQWQGSRPPTSGLACVIIQSNYGLRVEPSVYSQIADANEHRLPWGVYTFMEGSGGAAEARLALSVSNGRGRTLGLWGDAEINAAYSQACAYTAQLAALSVHIYGIYSAPGIYRGGRCAGYLWPAEWGSSGPYPFAGYGAGSILLWQYSGTEALDKDSDRGLIALGQAPSSLVRRIHAVRALLSKHRCRTVHGRRAFRLCPYWAQEGQRLHRELGR